MLNLCRNFRLSVCLLPLLILSACMSAVQQQEQSHSDAIFNVLAGEFSLRQDGATEQTLSHYNKALEKTSNIEVIRHAARLAFEQGDYALVLRAAEKWSQLEPDNMPLHQFLAVIYLTVNAADKAIAMLESLREKDASDHVFSEISKHGLPDLSTGGLQGIQTVAEHFSSSALAQSAYAAVALQTGEYELALSAVERAIELAPETPSVHKTKALVLGKLNRLEEAATALKRAVELGPEDLSLRESYAQLLSGAGLKYEAYEQWLSLYRKQPDSPAILQNLGLLSLDLGKSDEAVKYFEELKQVPGFNLRALYYLAIVFHKDGKLAAALSLLGQIPPESGEVFEQAQLLMTRLYLETDEMDKAIDQLGGARQATDSRDSRLMFYLAEGEILNEKSLYQQSFALYSEAIEEFGDDIDLRQLRAFAAIKINDLESMERDLQYVLSVDASNVDALNMLGYTFADLNIRLDEAKQYLARAYALSPDDPRIIDSMGWLEFRFNNFEEAERLIRHALEKYSDPEIYGHLVEILRVQKRLNEAEQVLREGLRRFSEDQYLNRLSRRGNPI